MIIHLQIDRLVLDELPVDQGSIPLLQAALETELSRLLASHPDPTALMTDGATQYLKTEPVLFSAGSDAGQLGRDVARSIHGGLSQ